MRTRTTADIVLLLLTGATAFIIVTAGLAIILAQFLHPDADLAVAASGIGDLINTLVGALIGYLAGSRVTKGSLPDNTPPESDAPGD